MNKTIDYLNNLFTLNDTLVVGVSSGPDSMCLLHLLCDLKDKFNLKIIVAHMNHKVRKEADEEAIFVEKFSKDNNLIYEYYELKEKIKSNFHSESRIIRYDFFDELMSKYNAKYLMTAHHSDDLMETILMRIGRGSNLKGYSGFELITKKNNYYVVKPLIFYTKDEIQNYMDINKYKYFIDRTNNDDDYLRNRYRHHILPELKKEDINIHNKYLKYSNTLLEVDNFINNYLNAIIDKIYNNNVLYVDSFVKEDKYIQKRIIEYILSTLYIDDLYKVDDGNINEILKMIYSNKPNLSIFLPNNHTITKEYNKVYVDKNKDINNVITHELYYEDDKCVIKEVKDTNDKSNYTIRLNTNEIVLPLKFRHRLEGDKMIIKNSKGHRKIKDIFIDLKIPTFDRNNIPLLVDNNDNVIWIAGYKKSNYDKDITEDYNLILKCEKK